MNRFNEAFELDRTVHQLHRSCMFDLMVDSDLHPFQPPILRAIRDAGRCNQCDLARTLGVSTASIATSIKRLEKIGYVTKQTDPRDLRYNLVCLTQQGEQAVDHTDHLLQKVIREKLRGFSDDELDLFLSFLKREAENLRHFQKELHKESD